MANQPWTIEGKKNALLTVRDHAFKRLLQAGSKLGLSPTDRARLSAPSSEKEEDVDSFIQGKPDLRLRKEEELNSA